MAARLLRLLGGGVPLPLAGRGRGGGRWVRLDCRQPWRRGRYNARFFTTALYACAPHPARAARESALPAGGREARGGARHFGCTFTSASHLRSRRTRSAEEPYFAVS